MLLGTLNDGSRDGALIVASRNHRHFVEAKEIAPTLQAALDDWQRCEGELQTLAADLEAGRIDGQPIDWQRLMAPLPRAFEWVDGSAYINHIVLVRRARGAEPPETLRSEPLVYQGGSGEFLSSREPIALVDPEFGLDFESEICCILGDTPQGTSAQKAPEQVRLLMLANDVTLRNLIPAELKKGFGFFQSKPATAFSPFALTPDELGTHWQDGRVHLPMRTWLNDALVGDPNAGPEMHFSFYDLIEHICKTRGFVAGTILGSGTVSNADQNRGISCLAERRMLEILADGKPKTPFLKAGDRVKISMDPKDAPSDAAGQSQETSSIAPALFGAIEQEVVAR